MATTAEILAAWAQELGVSIEAAGRALDEGRIRIDKYGGLSIISRALKARETDGVRDAA